MKVKRWCVQDNLFKMSNTIDPSQSVLDHEMDEHEKLLWDTFGFTLKRLGFDPDYEPKFCCDPHLGVISV